MWRILACDLQMWIQIHKAVRLHILRGSLDINKKRTAKVEKRNILHALLSPQMLFPCTPFYIFTACMFHFFLSLLLPTSLILHPFLLPLYFFDSDINLLHAPVFLNAILIIFSCSITIQTQFQIYIVQKSPFLFNMTNINCFLTEKTVPVKASCLLFYYLALNNIYKYIFNYCYLMRNLYNHFLLI